MVLGDRVVMPHVLLLVSWRTFASAFSSLTGFCGIMSNMKLDSQRVKPLTSKKKKPKTNIFQPHDRLFSLDKIDSLALIHHSLWVAYVDLGHIKLREMCIGLHGQEPEQKI